MLAIEEEMSQEGFWNDPDRANSRVASLKESRNTCETLDRLIQDIDELDVLRELAEEEGGDADAEIESAVAEMEVAFADLELRTMLSGPYDQGNAQLTIQAGAGGTDASDWAQMLLRMYGQWANRMGYKTKLLDSQEHEEAGIRHATLEVTGPRAYGYLAAEMGVHRLVRISPFDAQARRQTSFAAIDVMPVLDAEPDIEIDDKDLKIDTYKAGGKGGQHVNKTESAVRITHLPTNTVVQCQNERSQHKNKAHAMKTLKTRLLQLRELERNQELKSMYDSKGEIAWGSQIRNYVLAPYQLVKDLRSNHETGNVQPVLDGDLQPFIESYLRHRAGQSSSS